MDLQKILRQFLRFRFGCFWFLFGVLCIVLCCFLAFTGYKIGYIVLGGGRCVVFGFAKKRRFMVGAVSGRR